MISSAASALSAQVKAILAGPMRRDIVAALTPRASIQDALGPLRQMMRSHVWTAKGRSVPLTAGISAADAATQREGFHALHDWDGVADRVTPEIIPVDVLDFVRAGMPQARPTDAALGVLIDCYFFHVLSLLALRVWDTDDPATALQSVAALLDALQGPDGSGQPFVNDAETLLLIATSHYEPDEHGFDELLTRVRTLSTAQQLAIAVGHAASLGAHLRFGFLATYGRQTAEMREDNVADYPWLRWSIATVLEALIALPPDELGSPRGLQLSEALLGGLTADTEALLAHRPLASRLHPFLPNLLPRFRALTPRSGAYSPLALFFNFSYNLIKGTVIDAVIRGEPWTVSYNDLLTGAAGGRSPLPSREALARTLMDYGRRNPERIRGEWLPVIAYDLEAGHTCHATTLATLERFSALASVP